jgi:DNA-binding transcriptional regulator YiaG
MSDVNVRQGERPDRVDDVIARGRARRRFRADPQFGRLLRIRAGLSQQEIAAIVGVKQSAVARWERGERTPRAEALIRYMDLLGRLEQEA